MQSVPGLQTEDTDSQRDEGHGLEEHKDQDGHDDLLELSLAGLTNGASTFLVELDVEGQLIIVKVSGANGDLGVSNWQLEGHVVRLDEALDVVEEITRGAACDVIGSTIFRHFNSVRDL